MEGMRGVPHTTINQKLAAIAAETAVVMAVAAANNDVGDDVGNDDMGDNDMGVDCRQWRR